MQLLKCHNFKTILETEKEVNIFKFCKHYTKYFPLNQLKLHTAVLDNAI
jgi:hypothetical protein